MPSPTRILIIRPSALGDVCRTVPALASLRAANPSAQIDWLVQDTFAPAIRHHPGLSSVVEFPASRSALPSSSSTSRRCVRS
jgi:ADP-heptose:LPS heptosyltransferase